MLPNWSVDSVTFTLKRGQAMQRFRDLALSSATLDDEAIATYVASFAQSTPGWRFPHEKSAEYSRMCSAPSCCVIYARGDLPEAAVHLISRPPGGLHVTNIVPLTTSQIGVEIYNALTASFAKELRAKVRSTNAAITVSLSKADIGLRDLISGKIVWRLFEQYINAHPLSHHPLDIGRLDRFICGLSRYSRRPFDAGAFQYLLSGELGWPEEEAARCRHRVEIGLSVLSQYRKS